LGQLTSNPCTRLVHLFIFLKRAELTTIYKTRCPAGKEMGKKIDGYESNFNFWDLIFLLIYCVSSGKFGLLFTLFVFPRFYRR
jgi:hypothetical protein